MEQGGGFISDITLERRTEGRNVPNFLHGSVAGKAGSAPSVPTDVGPVATNRCFLFVLFHRILGSEAQICGLYKDIAPAFPKSWFVS